MIAGAKAERGAKGHIIIDSIVVADTLQCCHCNAHFVSVHGSGTVRGFCMACAQVTCGGPRCDVHVPFEKRLDLYEKGKIRSLMQREV